MRVITITAFIALRIKPNEYLGLYKEVIVISLGWKGGVLA